MSLLAHGAQSLAALRMGLQALGPWGPVAMVGVMVVQQILPLFPGGILLALCGVLFGVPGGTLTAVCGSLAASATTHTLGRGPGRAIVEHWVGASRLVAIEQRLAHHGFRTVAAIRAFPLFPSYLVGYAAGIIGMPLRTYLLGTFLGVLPGNFLHVLLGDRLSNPRDPSFILAAIALVAYSGAAFWLERRMRQRSGTDGVAARSGSSSEPLARSESDSDRTSGQPPGPS